MPEVYCIRCGKTLTGDDIGAHKKLISRGAAEFMCISCLAGYFRVPEALVREKIEYFRRTGCMLFSSQGMQETSAKSASKLYTEKD